MSILSFNLVVKPTYIYMLHILSVDVMIQPVYILSVNLRVYTAY